MPIISTLVPLTHFNIRIGQQIKIDDAIGQITSLIDPNDVEIFYQSWDSWASTLVTTNNANFTYLLNGVELVGTIPFAGESNFKLIVLILSTINL